MKVRLAERVPAAVGLKTSVAVQLAPTDKLAAQVLPERTKSDGLVPVRATLLMLRADVPPFASVTDCDALPVPNAVLPKAMLGGLAATTPLVAKPESATLCGLLLSESAKFNVAVRVPVAVGPNTMFAVQLAPGASVVAQVLLKTAKSPGFVPLKLMLLMLMVAVPGLVSVTTFCPPLDPIATAAQVSLAGETVAACIAFAAMRTENSTSSSLARFELMGPL